MAQKLTRAVKGRAKPIRGPAAPPLAAAPLKKREFLGGMSVSIDTDRVYVMTAFPGVLLGSNYSLFTYDAATLTNPMELFQLPDGDAAVALKVLP